MSMARPKRPQIRAAYTTGQAAELLKLGKTTVRKLVDAGKLKSWLVPETNHRRVSHAELVRFAKDRGIPLEFHRGQT